jgi:hypothetical protein
MNRYSPKIYDEICIYYQSDFRSRVERSIVSRKMESPKGSETLRIHSKGNEDDVS